MPPNSPSAVGPVFMRPKRVTQITGLSPRQQTRLEEKRKFPARIKMGEGRNGAIAYVESEIRTWMDEQIARRDRGREQDDGTDAAANTGASKVSEPAEVPPALKRGRGSFRGPNDPSSALPLAAAPSET